MNETVRAEYLELLKIDLDIFELFEEPVLYCEEALSETDWEDGDMDECTNEQTNTTSEQFEVTIDEIMELLHSKYGLTYFSGLNCRLFFLDNIFGATSAIPHLQNAFDTFHSLNQCVFLPRVDQIQHLF